ncbi:MAG: hypothetical protein LKE46_14895 [Clostridium sp.]|jgi:hypothetical protein|uniref:hypothetical protein n=1 Tax=Clostridium sp. TaxID=1506 RepID=UPI0025C1D641|nr:hypothetical protein [Clostridium sp.]MCH3965523.1 hypothetical protein [Clostridium sp.]MCI1716852.1 hypothetical protein [Clostridium sp.]MCI1801218.1 hypothetical protein [Clostridium sp.]MCI1815038.1 hypothetical protein [Clostridium sp.]MCI1871939.1 hypothetical protein [Clostridium sp.]
MADLKGKLAKKINLIESNDNNKLPKENSNNIILLNNSESDKNISIVPDLAISLNEAKNRILMLQNFVKEMMIVNIDYGFIPNCTKPSLFKSGAEKLCDIFGFSKKIEVINRVENWEKSLFHYEIKTTLINKKTGLIEAEGIGSCNNRERKYKTQDGYSIINTILKMAKKRAFIDAVLSATRSSGLFTQDIEDSYFPSGNDAKNKKPYTEHKSSNTINSNSSHVKKYMNKDQQYTLISIIKQNNIPINKVKELMKKRYKISEGKNLSSIQSNDFIKYLKIYTAI